MFNSSNDHSTAVNQIVYFDRYQKKTCIEKVYGDKYLRWTYGTVGGKLALAAVVKLRLVFALVRMAHGSASIPAKDRPFH